MSAISAWAVVLLYPAVMSFGYLLDPARTTLDSHSQAYARPSEALIASLQASKEERGRWFVFVKLAVTGAFLYFWLSVHGDAYSALGLKGVLPWRLIPLGTFTGSLLFGAWLLYQTFFARMRSGFVHHYLSRGRTWIWLVTFCAAGAVEETWRALSLHSLGEAGHSPTVGVGATAVAFLFAHLAGIPARIPGTMEDGLWEALLGSVLAVLFLSTHSILTPYIASLLDNSARLYWIRYKAARARP